MPSKEEVCKRGALAIERQIDRELEVLEVPIASRTWLLDVNKKFSADVEIIYECGGEKVTAQFTSEEIFTYRQKPMPQTLKKIARISAQLREAYLRGEKKQD